MPQEPLVATESGPDATVRPACPVCGEGLLVLGGPLRCPRCGLMLCEGCDGGEAFPD